VTRRFDLEGRVAVVVGTSANIGAGIALGLAQSGAAVACLDKAEHIAKLAARDIAEQGGQAIGVRCDSTDPDSVAVALAGAREAFGVVDVLVNGAAFYNSKGIREMNLDEWRSQIGVILDSAFIVTQQVVRGLIDARRPGSVLTLTSTAAYQGERNNVAYSTAKSGLVNFARSVATELAPYGIRSNSLSPTGTDLGEAVERSRRWGIEEPPASALAVVAKAARLLPLGVAPSPSHYADAAVFLSSDAAEMITGLDLRVDAGAVASYWRDELPVPPEDGPDGR
jgi:NAD(P)-dependent dehydrogenase (short-subunit alcohol dehydrogenase family)